MMKYTNIPLHMFSSMQEATSRCRRNLGIIWVMILWGLVQSGCHQPNTSIWPQQIQLPQMVYLPGGQYLMGHDQRKTDESPAHWVKLDPFYLSTTEVTNAQYLAFVQETQLHHPQWLEPDGRFHFETGFEDHYRQLGTALIHPDHPVVGISWQDAQAYCEWLSSFTDEIYRLPTEAEWEYAAGGGPHQRTAWGGTDSLTHLDRYANGCDNRCGEAWRVQDLADGYAFTAPVGSFEPNALGLYDLSGNVWEWCEDRYAAYTDSFLVNPLPGTTYDAYRVIRGGSWRRSRPYLRVTNREEAVVWERWNALGFRVARSSCE